ncbi:hypothetical protein Zmor_014705 [Zophobas morio]|uniref:Uncharacterized protein n=1 Tax=Zophobas morio TaxID=2755281 RepID=A0AA38MGC5_9CUCU|nr:hypothetical protein Zmor_014705 [Zophobas morio]
MLCKCKNAEGVVRIQFEFLNFKRIPRAQETVGKKKRLATNDTKKGDMRASFGPLRATVLVRSIGKPSSPPEP